MAGAQRPAAAVTRPITLGGHMEIKNLRVLEDYLERGAVGLGEEHDCWWARQIVINWMEKGLVEHLVLEVQEDDDELKTYDQLIDFGTIMQWPDRKWKNQIGLSDLIFAAAVLKEMGLPIKLHCWDPCGSYPSPSVSDRNKTVAAEFKKEFAASSGSQAVNKARKCVFLFGVAHFSGKKSIDFFLDGELPWMKVHPGIGIEQEKELDAVWSRRGSWGVTARLIKLKMQREAEKTKGKEELSSG